MVEAEAARAEAEEPDEEEEEEEETQAEPEPASEPEPGAFAQIGPAEIARAEKARDGYRKRIGSILGAESVVHECLLCAGLGYLPDLPPTGTTFGIVQTDTGPALLAEEPLQEPEWREAPDKMTCDYCAGLGQTLTGSKTPHARLGQCGRCNGNGWVPSTAMAGDGPSSYNIGPITPAVVSAGIGLVNDPWGRPPGHQHYGVAPSLIPG